MAQMRGHAETIAGILSRRKPAARPPLNRTNVLHTYRHILRQVSYLPPAIRKNIQEPIVKRFHQHQRDTPGLHDGRRYDRARNTLRMLRSANAGDKEAYQKLIERAFGRSWIRRYKLMEEHFLGRQAKSGPQNSKELEEAVKEQDKLHSAESSARAAKPMKKRGYQRWDMDEILKALKLQRSRQQKNTANSWPLGEINKIDPNKHVPEKNIWNKPPAPELVATKQEKYWDIQIDRLEAPLDKKEWELLEQLSRGLQNTSLEWDLPRRRTPAQQRADGDQALERQEWDWERFASQPIATIERAKRHDCQRRSGERPLGPYGRQASTVRTLPARWFRRAYMKTLMLAPYTEQDPKTMEKTLKWGSSKLRAGAPSPMQMAVFEDVPEEERKPKGSRKRQT